MPNTKSAVRRVRRVKKQTKVNRIRKSKYKNAIKHMESLIKAEDKEKALKLLELDLIEMQEVSKRWDSDMKSDSWLSKNTRPITLIYLTLITSLYIILDSLNIAFDIDESWVELLKTLLVTIYVAYFGSRGFEKYTTIKK